MENVSIILKISNVKIFVGKYGIVQFVTHKSEEILYKGHLFRAP